MTPQERADRSTQAMWASDNASKWAGMQIISVGEGQATLELTVQPEQCNGHLICHGA